MSNFVTAKSRSRSGKGSNFVGAGGKRKFDEAKHCRSKGKFVSCGGGGTKAGAKPTKPKMKGKGKFRRAQEGTDEQRAGLARQIRTARAGVKTRVAHSKLTQRVRELRAIRRSKEPPQTAPTARYAPAKTKAARPSGTPATTTAAGKMPTPAEMAAKDAAITAREKVKAEAELAEFRTRFSAYTAGDAKVARIAGIGDRVATARAEVERADRAVAEAGTRHKEAKPGSREWLLADQGLRDAMEQSRAARTRHESAELVSRRDLLKVLAVPDTARVKLEPKVAAGLKGDGREAADTALGFLGRVTADSGAGPIAFRVKAVPGSHEQREFYQNGAVHLGRDTAPATAVHELGHMLEEQVPGWDRAAQAFLRHRVGNEKPTQLNTLGGDHGVYRDNEFGRKDRFDEAFGSQSWYVGKDYGGFGGSEVTAMGLEKLYEDPFTFARKDPEFTKFLLGALDGSLR